MPVNDTARRNHDELFPDHVSTLAVTDPELLEVSDNFAFDEVLRHGGLDTRQQTETRAEPVPRRPRRPTRRTPRPLG